MGDPREADHRAAAAAAPIRSAPVSVDDPVPVVQAGPALVRLRSSDGREFQLVRAELAGDLMIGMLQGMPHDGDGTQLASRSFSD